MEEQKQGAKMPLVLQHDTAYLLRTKLFINVLLYIFLIPQDLIVKFPQDLIVS